MKRDMELIRKIAFAIEDAPSGYAPTDLTIGEFTKEQVGYHAYLMIDGGLATGNVLESQDDSSPEAMLTSLTWHGHDFIELARDDTRWKKAMRFVKEKAGAVTIPILTQVLTQHIRGLLELP